jgi:hypothetical protein
MDWYWSLMVLWLAGISIFQKKRDIQLTKKGVRVEVDAKQRGVLVSVCEARVVFGDCNSLNSSGEEVHHMLRERNCSPL